MSITVYVTVPVTMCILITSYFELPHPTTSNIGVSFISLHDTPRPHTLNRVIRNLMRLAHI